MNVSTIGFARKSAKEFFGLLRRAGAKRIVDVRLSNSSQLAGFAKKDDLAWFAREICGMDYVHLPDLAPTKELLGDYRKRRIPWNTYEDRFMALMRQRRVEVVPRGIILDGCPICNDDKPHHCHRSLVVEHPSSQWGMVQVVANLAIGLQGGAGRIFRNPAKGCDA